jgi:hypothetical protein
MKRCTALAQNALSAVLEPPMAIATGHEHALSDQQIIDLHVRFLTHGFQHIQVPSIKEGRELMQTLLSSLDYYHAVACLTSSDIQLPNDAKDLFSILVEGRYVPNNLEPFFLEYGDFDFLWLELMPHLLVQPWLEEFKALLIDHNMHIKMPIMCISYDQPR